MGFRWGGKTNFGSGGSDDDPGLKPLMVAPIIALGEPPGRNLQMRAFANGAALQTRAAAPANGVHGLVCPFNTPSCDLGGFREIYLPGCFSASLASDDDILCLAHHSPDMVLGRRSSGTAFFFESDAGLNFDVPTLPDTQAARDLKVLMKRGDISESSAAFYIQDYSWEQRQSIGRVRLIKQARLVECSVACLAAYGSATTAELTEDQLAAAAAMPFWSRARL